jgi:hypothetical protein
MTEYLCLTLLADPGESEAAFKGRLTAFWTHMIRARPDDYELVYAEEKAFETEAGRVCRRYMIDPAAVPVLTAELAAHKMTFAAIDEDDLYSKAEASSPEWFQIPHD